MPAREDRLPNACFLDLFCIYMKLLYTVSHKECTSACKRRQASQCLLFGSALYMKLL